MKRFKKIISFIMVLLILFSNLQFSYRVAAAVYTTDSEAVALDKEWLTASLVLNGNSYNEVNYSLDYVCYYNITENLNIPVEGANGSIISWTSSNEQVVAPDGVVTRPSYNPYLDEVSVTLTATISKGEVNVQKVFNIYVSSYGPITDEEIVQADYAWLSDTLVFNGTYASDIKYGVTLPVLGGNGCTISWVSSNEEAVALDGTVNRPSFTQGNTNVILTATISKGTAEVQKTFNLTVVALDPTAVEKVAFVEGWLTDDLVLSGNSAGDVKVNLYLPEHPVYTEYPDYGINSISISWESSNISVVALDGTVTRPAKDQENVPVTLTAIISCEEAIVEKTFNILVTKVEEFPLALKFDDFSDTGDSLQFNGNSLIIDTLDRGGNSIKALQLGNDVLLTGGSVFTKNKLHLSEDMSFSTAFSFRNVHSGYTLGDSGFTFTLQPTDNTAYGIGGISPSLGIAFDTEYYGATGSGQGTFYGYSNSMAVLYNGINDATYENGRLRSFGSGSISALPYYNIWIEYNGSLKKLEIRVNTDSNRPKNPTLQLNDVDLGQILANGDASLGIIDVQEVYAGFTGSVMEKDKSQIWGWYFKNDPVPVDFAPYSFIDASNITLVANPPGGTASSTVTVEISGDGGPVEGMKVDFSTSLGSLNSISGITDAAGKASVLLSTVTAGTAIVKAIAAGGATALIEVPLALSDGDCVAFDEAWLTEDRVLNGNSVLGNITKDLSLPQLGQSGSVISWSSSNEAVVALDGKVTMPLPAEGDKEVTLTATISKGTALVTKEFNITVKVPDADKANADSDWLTDERILNGNSSFDSIAIDLNMPGSGPYGSTISWTSSREDVVSPDGKVTRTTCTQGDQEIELIATITNGSAMVNKVYNITVKAKEPTDAEAVALDNTWLTDEIVLNGDSIVNNNINNVTENLNLPVSGPNGSTIGWVSTEDTVIAANGTVSRPTYTQGSKTVTLTANIYRGTEYVEKTFNLIVTALDQSVDEALAEDSVWLDISRTLGVNSSQYSVKYNLFLPSSAPEGSSITWTSGTPGVISDSGAVTRPEYLEGHKSVTLTATLKKGEEQVSKVFIYTVLSIPDTTPPVIVNTTPENDSIGVIYNTRQISVTFNENIAGGRVSWRQAYGIELHGPSTPSFYVRIDKNRLIITLDNDMAYGVNELVIPAGAVTDMSGNFLKEEFRLSFSIEQRLVYKIEVVSSKPVDREKLFPVDSEISFSYSYGEIVEGRTFHDIFLRFRDGDKVPVTCSLSGNTVTLALGAGASLKPGAAYEMFIPAGAVKDRFENESSGKTILFIVQGDDSRPEVTGTYPLDGQSGVDIHQNIQIYFSEKVKAASGKIKLKDDKGNEISIATGKINAAQNSVTIQPYKPLQPNTKYTVIVPYNFVKNSSGNTMAFDDYSMSFTTGANLLGIKSIYPISTDADKGAPIDTSVKIEFSSTVTRGPNYTGVKIYDSQGKPVNFNLTESDNKVVLTPFSKLSPSETYTVDIPAGAYTNESNALNDALKFNFITASKLNIASFGSFSFVVKPSPNWLADKPMVFSADGVESAFRSAGNYKIKSYEWSFGDARTGTGKNISHTYNVTGNFTVTLRVEDINGISYEFKQVITIDDYNSNDVKMTVTPGWHQELTHTDTYNSYNPGYKLYPIELSYDGKYICDEEVKVLLYKDGKLVKNLGTATTGIGDKKYVDEWGYTHFDNGTALFRFWYTDKELLGTYELVFVYGNIYGGTIQGKTLRIPVTITDSRGKQDLNIKLYNKDAGKFVEYSHGLYFEVDGVQRFAERKWHSEKEGYCYVIDDVETDIHTLKLVSSNGFTVHNSSEEYILHSGVENVVILTVEGKQPGLNRVWSEVSDSRSHFNTIFIKGVSMPNVRFEFEGDWDYLEPGYYEVMKNKGNYIQRTAEPWIELNPSYLIPGEKLLVRMVSRNGIKSSWVDAKVETVLPPKLNTALNISYVDGEYRVDTAMNFSELLGDKIDMLDDIPLLDHSRSFGFFGSDNKFEGVMYNSGSARYMKLQIQAGGSYVTKKKKPKMLCVGYEMSAELYGNMYLIYDKYSREWRLRTSELTVMGDLSKYWKKGYKVPEINVGAEGIISIGAIAGGTLYIDKSENSEREYSGILYFEPYVTGSIYAGLDWVNVEGYVDGRIPSQVHIPTGYIQVDPILTAGINATFLTYTETLYSMELKTHWDNGEDKVKAPLSGKVSQLMTVEFDKDDSRLTQMSRSYLNQDSRWLAGDQVKTQDKGIVSLLAGPTLSFNGFAAEESNPLIETMKDNIYPYADVNLVKNGEKLYMVWTDDNPERTAVNRTQMKYSVLEGDVWSEPLWIGNDGTADFTPVLASAGDGVLMAWQNINKPVIYNAEPGELIENAEISVTKSIFGAEGSDVNASDIITLTSDKKFDHSPKLAADGSNALLVWTKSEGLGFTLGDDMEKYQSSDNSDILVFSSWNGSTWSTPEEIQGSLPTVVNSSLTMHGGEGLLLYTLDMDNDQSTQEDREVFARIYSGNSWGEEIRITDNQVSDSNPKAVYSNEEWFITWYQDGSIMYKEGLYTETKTVEFPGSVQSNYDITVDDGIKPQIALVYQQIGDSYTRTLSTAFYDIDKGVWSQEIPLTEGEGFVRSFSPVFSDDGRLNIAFTKAEVITEVIEGVEYQNTGDKVDLCMLNYTPVHDLALEDEDGLQLSTEIPLPGTLATVSSTIRNQGDFAENATLYLYDGPPENGVKIGEVMTEQPIPARSSAQVEIEWIVGAEEKTEYDIYAVVRPSKDVIENDEDNNTVNHKISTADIAVTSLECENLANDDYLVTATVANRGSRTLDGINILLNHVQTGQALETRGLESLRPGQEVVLSLLIASDGLTGDEAGNINMTFSALLPDGVEEYSTDNNIFDFVLEPAPIVVDSMKPAQGETQVGIQDSLTLTFNMNVGEGEEFDQITLEDDSLNIINLNKTIAGNTLTLTPQSALAHDTRYTLTIPRGALGDSYGHTMESSYGLNFVTATSSPEVVFAYPGYEMKNIALDTEIKMQFNQDVLQGPAFGNIVMYGSNSEEIPAAISMQGEWLYIHPAGHLKENTLYSLTIPRGAVKNDLGEAQQEDYSLSFETGVVDEVDDGVIEGDSGQPAGYTITRQTLMDGTTIVDILIDSQLIIKTGSADKATVIADLTDEVKYDNIIRVSLTEGAENQLISDRRDLKVITGKGDISFPIDWIESLHKEDKNSVTITLTKKNSETIYGMVSDVIFDFMIAAGKLPVTEFDNELVVTIPLDMSRVKKAKRVIVCGYDEATDSWQPVGGVADATAGTVTFKLGHFSSYAAFETSIGFNDVTSDWAKEKVEILASRHLIFGTTDNTYGSEGSVTRAQFTALIVRSLYKELFKSKGTFADVAEGAWYADAVETANNLGLVNGTGNHKFDPNAEISREQLAVIAYRLYKYKYGEVTVDNYNTLTDHRDISSYAEDAVNFVANAGIMVGSSSKFEPQRSTTRQEAAVVLYRLLEYMGEL